MRQIRMPRVTWRGLETGSRRPLNGHEAGNGGHSQGGASGVPRQSSTLPTRGRWGSRTVGLVRHRQPKGADTDRLGLPAGGQCSTLPKTALADANNPGWAAKEKLLALALSLFQPLWSGRASRPRHVARRFGAARPAPPRSPSLRPQPGSRWLSTGPEARAASRGCGGAGRASWCRGLREEDRTDRRVRGSRTLRGEPGPGLRPG